MASPPLLYFSQHGVKMAKFIFAVAGVVYCVVMLGAIRSVLSPAEGLSMQLKPVEHSYTVVGHDEFFFDFDLEILSIVIVVF